MMACTSIWYCVSSWMRRSVSYSDRNSETVRQEGRVSVSVCGARGNNGRTHDGNEGREILWEV